MGAFSGFSTGAILNKARLSRELLRIALQGLLEGLQKRGTGKSC